jgi:hypothetical protein
VKTEWRTFAGVGLFVLPIALIYGALSTDPAGTALLLFAAAALVVVGAYLLSVHRTVGDRPEDRADAEPGDAAGEIEELPSASIWPLVLGIACTALAWGLAFTAWITVPAAIVLAYGITGMARESEAGRHPER